MANGRPSSPRRWWDKPITADPQRRWWLGSISAGVLTTIAWVAQVVLGQDLPAVAYVALLILGASSAFLAFLLPLRQAAGARGRASQAQDREREASRVATDAVREYRVRLHEVMIPIARLVGKISSLPDGEEKRTEQDRLLQSVVDLAAENIGPTSGTRACFFDYIPGPPREFYCFDIFRGRTDGPRGGFREGTGRGNAVLELVDQKRTRFVKDVNQEQVEGFVREEADYQTFICTPVVAGDRVIGLLTVDAPNPGDLREIDNQEARLFALALGCGLADRPLRTRTAN